MEASQPPMMVEKPVPEAQVSTADQPQASVQEPTAKEEGPMEEAVDSQTAEGEREKEDDSEPFADILENSKDKKRYSSNPLPQQQPEQTSYPLVLVLFGFRSSKIGIRRLTTRSTVALRSRRDWTSSFS